MKNLFKFTVVAVATSISLTSCNEGGSNDGTSIYTVLTELESTNYETNKVATYEMGFKRSEVEVSGTTYIVPLLSEVSATNGEFRTAKYEYTQQDDVTILKIEVQKESGLYSESYKLNDLGMAEEVLVGDTYTKLEDVEYNSSGYRTKWGEYTLDLDGEVYQNAKKEGNNTINYIYTQYSNRISLQQFGIIGADFYQNVTDNFGKQSRQLLSEINVEEDGKNVTYKFAYAISADGFVTEELVYRDGEKYIRNKYSYAMVVYSDDDKDSDK